MFCYYFRLLIVICYLLVTFQSQNSTTGWQSSIFSSHQGVKFYPNDFQSLLLFESHAKSAISCAAMCQSTALCRIFDYDDQSHACRIFEGDINTMGSLVASSSSYSRVGSITLRSEQFANYGSPCSYCENNRCLTCINSICQCQSHTFFDGSICQSQRLLGGGCTNAAECRTDLSYTCLPRMQCGPLSLQNGFTVGGYENGTAGTTLNALQNPLGLSMGVDNSLYVSDQSNHRVIKLNEGSSSGSIIAGTGVLGNSSNQLNNPTGLSVDASSDIYIGDSGNCRAMLWRQHSSSGIRVVGTGVPGNTLSTVTSIAGLVVDSLGNIYLSDPGNHRVIKWTPNATNGILVAGSGASGSDSQQLNTPYGLFLDESNSYLYVADTLNHRIQRYHLGVSMSGTTVAGGNGQGTGNHQLDGPSSIYVSEKTGAIYIADSYNHRIQCWSSAATSGVTIVGMTGFSGTSATLFNMPMYVILNSDETYLYVSDWLNNRVQRFPLI